MSQQMQRKRWQPAVKTYEPVFDKLVIDALPTVDEIGGLLLPEGTGHKYETRRARVLARGPDCKSAVKVGDVVLVPGGDWEVVVHRGHRTFVVAENQIWGIEIPEEKERAV